MADMSGTTEDDFYAQIQQEIDTATAKAFEKQVAAMLGFDISEVPEATFVTTSASLTKEMVLKAAEKVKKDTLAGSSLLSPSAPWSAGYMELKPPSPSDEYDLFAYGKVLDEDFLLELGVNFTEKQKANEKAKLAMMQSFGTAEVPTFISLSNPRRQIEQACPGLEEHVQAPCACYIESPEDALLSAVIMHLNDKHAWTREKIADWLDDLDVDLTIDLEAAPTPRRYDPITISAGALKFKEDPELNDGSWAKQYLANGNMYVTLHTNDPNSVLKGQTS
jgi:hypothetical protein